MLKKYGVLRSLYIVVSCVVFSRLIEQNGMERKHATQDHPLRFLKKLSSRPQEQPQRVLKTRLPGTGLLRIRSRFFL